MYRSQYGLFIVEHNGLFQESRTHLFINSLAALQENLKEQKAKGLLISMPQVKTKPGSKEFAHFIALLEKLDRKIPVVFGFIDYDTQTYRQLRQLTAETSIKLFKNLHAARLFLDPKAYKSGMEVLLFDEDEANARKLAAELGRFGYSVIMAKSAEHFHDLIDQHKYNMFVTQSSLNRQNGANNSTTSKPLQLSKQLIMNLPVFVDTAVETLVSFTGLEAQKSSHSIKHFELKSEQEMLYALMRFKGDIEGVFVLIFPLELAHIAIKAMLGEEVGEKDYDMLKDGVGELCNIITGGSKTILSNQSIKVTFELPRTYTSLKSALGDIGENSGVWIDMQLASKPFYMFITR